MVAADEESSGGASDFEEAIITHQRLIPQGTAAFVKEMLGVSSKEKRRVAVPPPLPEPFSGQHCSDILLTRAQKPGGNFGTSCGVFHSFCLTTEIFKIEDISFVHL